MPKHLNETLSLKRLIDQQRQQIEYLTRQNEEISRGAGRPIVRPSNENSHYVDQPLSSLIST